MKNLFLLSMAVFMTLLSHSQKKKNHYWTQVKTTDCRSKGISPKISLGSKSISISTAYTWDKTVCDEVTYNNAIKIPKLKKGYHIAPDGKHYYNDGDVVYQVIGKSCGTQTWTPEEFWTMMQKK
jgi:hypothetical protein